MPPRPLLPLLWLMRAIRMETRATGITYRAIARCLSLSYSRARHLVAEGVDFGVLVQKAELGKKTVVVLTYKADRLLNETIESTKCPMN